MCLLSAPSLRPVCWDDCSCHVKRGGLEWMERYRWIVTVGMCACVLCTFRLPALQAHGAPVRFVLSSRVHITSDGTCTLLVATTAYFIFRSDKQNDLLSCCRMSYLVSCMQQKALTPVINDRGKIDAIFIDFSKAFDVVPHIDLITTMHSIGNESNIISWLECYLRNRKQFVPVDNHVSDSLNFFSEVPHGSVLGPILLFFYINDIHLCIHSPIQLRLFADDCVIYLKVNSTKDPIQLNHSLQSIHAWCKNGGKKVLKCKNF